MAKSIINILFILLCQVAHGQNKHWIYFTNKGEIDTSIQVISERTIQNRIRQNLPLIQLTDYPLNQEYLDSLKYYHVQVVSQSRWLNAVSATIDSEMLEPLSTLDFVQEVQPLTSTIYLTTSSSVKVSQLGFALEQINGQVLIEQGLNGAGVSIGIIDGGFLKADQHKSLERFFVQNLVKGYRDYITPQSEPYSGVEALDDAHGTQVWQMLGGFNSSKDIQFGLATHAYYYLARTDHGKDERRREEDFWIAAMEWMDSCGVQVINSSLGYTKGFDNPKENYLPQQMDGKSTAITRAAQIAASQKGIFMVISAGNDGNDKDWLVLSAPADAKDVLTVGATRFKYWDKASYSSIGPEFLPYLKPNISCFSSKGTSFSAPIMTGLVACLLQQDSSFSNQQIIELIEKAGHLYPYGNNYLGYGVPDARKILQLMSGENLFSDEPKTLYPKGKKVTLKFPDYPYDYAILFHKKDKINVVAQEIITSDQNKMKIIRPQNVNYTSIASKDKVLEIIWKQ